MNKKLLINADDYGICPEVNRAIENLVKLKKLQNVSVLANSWFYEETVDFLLAQPACSVGIHLNIVEGISLSPNEKVQILLDKNGQFANLKQILFRWLGSPLAVSKAVESEWRKQIEQLLNDGLIIAHADSHQHIHAFPPFWRILVKLCREFNIPGMRFPGERNKLRLRSISAAALEQSATISKAVSSSENLVFNRHFLGFKRAGLYGEAEIINDLENLEEGLTELIVHPSLYDGLPYPHFHGEIEYQALRGTKIWQRIGELNIEILSWSDVSKTSTKNIKDEIAVRKF